MKVGDEFTIPEHVRSVDGTKVGLIPVIVTGIMDISIMVKSKLTGNYIQLAKSIDMSNKIKEEIGETIDDMKEDIEEYFEPVDKGNWKGFTFKQFISQYKWLIIIVSIMAIVALVHGYLINDKTLMYGGLFFVGVVLITIVASIVSWGGTKDNMER